MVAKMTIATKISVAMVIFATAVLTTPSVVIPNLIGNPVGLPADIKLVQQSRLYGGIGSPPASSELQRGEHSRG